MRDSSADLLRMATDSLTASAKMAQESVSTSEREAARDRSLSELTVTVGKLDVTVANLYLGLMANGQSRTVLRRDAQVGEVAPGSPGTSFRRTQPDLPPEGLAPESPTGSSPASDQVRRHAFGEPT